MLPAKVYKKLEQIFASFLWSSPAMDPHKMREACKIVTQPRKDGGLGIKKLSEWGKAKALKHLWHIINNKIDCMWMNWVKIYLLRGRRLW